MPKPRVRCPDCRMWIDCNIGATKVPQHDNLATKTTCPGSNKLPAEHQGW